jgi:hypothetical protein
MRCEQEPLQLRVELMDDPLTVPTAPAARGSGARTVL